MDLDCCIEAWTFQPVRNLIEGSLDIMQNQLSDSVAADTEGAATEVQMSRPVSQVW
jgi:hypothetical protein